MKKNECEKYKQTLVEMKEKITGLCENITRDILNAQMKETSGDLSGYSLHMADVATDNFDREFALGIAGRENEIIQQIDEALQKIEDKEYGICEICQAAISEKRLEALPYAPRCIKCESEIEKEQA